MKQYYEKLYVNKYDNLDETDKCIEGHKLSKHTQEEIDNLNSLIYIFSFCFSNKNLNKVL